MSKRDAAVRKASPTSKSGEHPAVRRLYAVIDKVGADSSRALDECAARLDEKIARVAEQSQSEGDSNAAAHR